MAEAVSPVVRAVEAFGWLNEAVGRFACWIAAALIAVMTGAVLLGVFFRYVLNNSLNWTEETAIMSAIWVAFLVAPWAYRNGGHVAIELLVSALPRPILRILRILINGLILWILYRFFTEALTYVSRGMGTRANSMDVPLAYFRAIVPVSLGMMFVIGVELIIRDGVALVMPRAELDLPHLASPIEPE